MRNATIYTRSHHLYTAISKNVVGEKCGYWILIENNLPWCRLHIVPTFDGEWYGLSIFFSIQWQRLHFSKAFMKGQWNAIFPNLWRTVVLSRSQLAVRTAVSVYRLLRTHCFCIPNIETTVPFGRAIFRPTTAIRRSLRQSFLKWCMKSHGPEGN